ncbi:alpha-amylase family glycosyl hydrolase [Brooklawnia sp.]|uniref:alpha-amylase family glycosyl hydrolase n=1 Tax=Brooklawnia sp. TaxID=2699740 RepID=UPI00311FE93E
MPDKHLMPRPDAEPEIYQARESDWRNGALIYQVIVDRFAPSANLASKIHLYPAPKRLHIWSETPSQGRYFDDYEVWSHEIDFWGGDLASLRGRLRYINGLGADVLYLCPIHLAWTNHGYDALDYQQVRPEYGTRDDVKQLADDLHERGMRLVLDGVFNHMGRNSPAFQAAVSDPDDPHRGWFDLNPDRPGGARAWANAVNLPELVIENPAVRDHIWAGRDSVVRNWLRDGIDGWRLDVAFELGPDYLGQLTAAAHDEKPGSLTLGEVCNYPAGWFPALDGVLNFTLREIVLLLANQQISAAHAQRMLTRFFADADYEHLLKSWNYLDNHDVPRVTDTIPDEAARRLATVLQFTLPGSVNLYYGTELGQTGGADPANRAPMRWDLVNQSNQVLRFHHQLSAIRRGHRALRIGDLRWLETERLIGFERFTDRIEDAVFVIANPSSERVDETVLIPDSWLMDMSGLTDHLSGERLRTHRATLAVTLQPHQVMVLTADLDRSNGYTPYKRVR